MSLGKCLGPIFQRTILAEVRNHGLEFLGKRELVKYLKLLNDMVILVI